MLSRFAYSPATVAGRLNSSGTVGGRSVAGPNRLIRFVTFGSAAWDAQVEKVAVVAPDESTTFIEGRPTLPVSSNASLGT